MRLLTRAVASASRRLGRPELLAAVNAVARQAQREDVGVSAVLACALGGDGTYVDIGANRGQVLREAVRVAPRGTHIAFEPIPQLAAELAHAFPQVDCRNRALGARAEVAEFCHFRQLDGWSGLRRNPLISDSRGDPEYISVEVSTLDEEMGDLTPNVVKIDVEGAELAVLEGARSVLREARPVVIFEHVYDAAEPYGVAPGAPWDLLTDLDYEIFSATGDGPFTRSAFTQSTSVVNWLATPHTRRGVRGQAPDSRDDSP
ncbi:MAG: FkbM family methyltransferase [Solirubrobacteraceae bacterium]|jgi:FkbM family methyltransferase